LRPSNTSPCLVLRFEAVNQTILTNIQSLFRTWMLSVEPDLILAAYFFAAAAVTHSEVKIQALARESAKQKEIEFLAVLEKMGCIVTSNEMELGVKGPEILKGVNVDIRNFSHTFMAVAAIAAFADAPVTITNIQPFACKKNRIQVMQGILQALKIQVETGPDWMKIFPSKPVAGTVDCQGDACVGMAVAVLGLRIAGLKLLNGECIEKVYPEFFDQWEKLTNSP